MLPYWDWTDQDKRDEIWNLIGEQVIVEFFLILQTIKLGKLQLMMVHLILAWNTICTNIEELAL